ncbi:Ca(2+)-dependent cysteine protease [Taiwanofungus camphoratus]|nr:Ca(2+)-dependent cysteine protease [Antrodia cinnamomea]KAI0951322.1 Ca(2+)-dependent cysteine protease [Antrodia cinnamomea]KAI0956228.1 Ca(2+)-dependent cysteine protease [Antrodia cinnamomea]
MWNNISSDYPGRYPPPPGPPQNGSQPYGFPSPNLPAPQSRGYEPAYSPGYAPPPGPSPGRYGSPFSPPPGPPPCAGDYPGQQHHHHHRHHQEGNYAPPSGPPPAVPPRPGYSGPPPVPARPHGQYAPPPGPPPAQSRTYAPPPGPPPRPPTQQQHYGPVFEGQNNQQQQPYFQYSQCTGRKKALCIGINYVGQDAELKGCINDAHNVRRFLCSEYGYQDDDIVMLTDDSMNPRSIPTKENMLAAMQWLVRGAQPHDSLFFHYSGHGGQTKDLDGDEEDGYDEVIYPVDFKQVGHIVDDLLHDIMVKPLPPGCRLTAIFDSCHSGSALDLPYVYSHEGKIKEPNLAAEAAQGLLGAVSSYARGDLMGAFSSVSGLVKGVSGMNHGAREVTMQTKTSPADVISWGGCRDSQTSADTFEAGQATGAMSYAFMAVLRQNRNQSYQQLLINIRNILASKYSQKPQLSSSHPMDTNLLFIC